MGSALSLVPPHSLGSVDQLSTRGETMCVPHLGGCSEERQVCWPRALLELAVLLGKLGSHWKAGTLGKGDKSISKTYFYQLPNDRRELARQERGSIKVLIKGWRWDGA